ncbi:hypothetical protein A6A06_39430 [Streptomyces sp. CB02923]|uniref:eCIS core domain-containing protein n=1 Tax=Streptomyces sp. CB02923 TaxID=1718985 RepID=UPI00095C08BB|nr:DUF4157 domain-containing protein [Streptomyces sp. CB02923]OKI03413.1 hypothetical protein A6A06_39430 [Streptomyces sp. CB02923]
MQQRDEAREAGTGGKRPAGRRAAPRAGGPHASLLALQAKAGNAAVVQTLRQAGHTGAAPDRHVHGAGCGHEQAEKPPVQRSAVHDVLRGAGRPLDDSVRADMEMRLGADFSDVRIHDDTSARASAAELGARAYTSGSHIVVGAGGGDRHTLAHELTHVIQQRRGPVSGTDHGDGVSVSDPSDRFEREAEATAARVLSLPPGHAAPAGTAASAPGTGHSPAPGTRQPSGPGVTAQRLTRGSRGSRRAGREDPGYALAEAQRTQIESLPALYVPAETFGRDGSQPSVPRSAYAVPQPGDVEILQMRASPLPAVSHHAPGPRADWPMKYQSGQFVYEIQMVNRPHRAGTTLIDPTRGFEVVKRKLKMRDSGHSAGRTYRFQERWAPNPAYWGPMPGPEAELAAQAAGLGPDSRLMQADLPYFRNLPAPRDQPFVFSVANDRVDPHFGRSDGTQKDSRKDVSAAHFDHKAARAGSGDTRLKAYTALSSPPQVGRGDAGRSPHRTMGNVQAHELMGDDGRKGSSGTRLASHEWCHLVGDGDGGLDIPENLVIGTNAVNTEQLAMETALRPLVPHLRARGYSIQLDVEVLVGKTPERRSGVPGGSWNLAKYISYRISLVPEGQVRSSLRREIHRQIMDGRRGTITELEFTYLRRTVRAKLEAAIEEIDEAERAHQAQAAAFAYGGAGGQYPGSAGQPSYY